MKKIFIVLLTLLISFQAVNVGHAEEFTEVEKRTKLARVLKGIGQRIGVSWTADALLMAVNSALEDEANGVEYGTQFVGRLPIMDASKKLNSEFNAQEYLLSPEDFKNGVKLIQNASSKNVGTYYPLGQWCYPAEMDQFVSGATHSYMQSENGGKTKYMVWGDFTLVRYSDAYKGIYIKGSNIRYKVYTDTDDDGDREWDTYTYGPQTSFGEAGSALYPNTTLYSTFPIDGNGFGPTYYQKDLCEYTTKEKPDMSPVSPVKTTYLDNYDKPTYIYVNENKYYTDPTPTEGNTVIPDEDFPQPVPDADGDGIPDNEDQYPNDPENKVPEPEDKPSGSSWWEWLLSPLIKLIELMKTAIDGLVEIVKGLAKAIADAIGAIFVPSTGFFDGFFNDIKTSWDSKIPIIGQLSDFMSAVESTSTNAAKPVIEVDLPERYGGVTISVIDFSYFDQYRTWIFNFIRFFAWFVFLKKLWSRLPRVIGG